MVNEIKPLVEKTEKSLGLKKPSFFETTVALAFKHFANNKIDIGVVEVGLGGRLDATNVLKPILSVITNVDLDHTDILGNTLEQIAKEKSGIIKKGVPVVSGAHQLAVKDIIAKKAEINTQRDEALLTDITIGLQNGDNVELQVSKDIFFVLQSMISAELNDIGWVLKDNSIVEFKQADFITFRDNLILRNDEIIQAIKIKDFIMILTSSLKPLGKCSKLPLIIPSNDSAASLAVLIKSSDISLSSPLILALLKFW